MLLYWGDFSGRDTVKPFTLRASIDPTEILSRVTPCRCLTLSAIPQACADKPLATSTDALEMNIQPPPVVWKNLEQWVRNLDEDAVYWRTATGSVLVA